MNGELKYITFNTSMGWIGLLASVKGLLTITLPQPSAEDAYRLLGSRTNQANRSLSEFIDLVERLKAYFGGNKVTFPDKLDLSEATPFQRQVREAVRLIHYGEARSYQWVAEQIGRPKAARAVGQTLGSNPLPVIVPCHRVIASSGKLGGFSGGLEMKKRLLLLEGLANDY